MGLRIPPHKFKIMLEPNPLKSRISVRRLAVVSAAFAGEASASDVTGKRDWPNQDLGHWEERFYTPPPPGSDF